MPLDIDALTVDQLALIQKEATLGLPPSLRSREALAYREVMDREVSQIRERGRIVDLPKEWPQPGEVEGAPAIGRGAPPGPELESSNLERSAEAGPCCEGGEEPPEQAEFREEVRRRYGKDSPEG